MKLIYQYLSISYFFGVENLSCILTEDIIVKKLLGLNSQKACGVDGVTSHEHKECAIAFSETVRIIFRKSLIDGYVPKLWKDANVTPIYKKDSRTLAVNHRNVSLTSLVCRILEGRIKHKLSEFFEKEGLIAKEHHGFVRRKECVTNLLEKLDLITKSLSEGFSVNVVYLDFLKLFDMASHRRLAEGLRH